MSPTQNSRTWDDEDTDRIDLAAIRRALGEDCIITEGREPGVRPRRLADRVPLPAFGTFPPTPRRMVDGDVAIGIGGVLPWLALLMLTIGIVGLSTLIAFA